MARKTGRVIAKDKSADGVDIVYLIRDSDWDEYRIELWVKGEHQPLSDYHSDNKEDAKQTMARILDNAINMRKAKETHARELQEVKARLQEALQSGK
jgi:hypothetical protein